MIFPQGSESIQLENHRKRVYNYHKGRLRDKLGLRYCSIKRVGYVQSWATYAQDMPSQSSELCWALPKAIGLGGSQDPGLQDVSQTADVLNSKIS